jgi:hypothetical protein
VSHAGKHNSSKYKHSVTTVHICKVKLNCPVRHYAMKTKDKVALQLHKLSISEADTGKQSASYASYFTHRVRATGTWYYVGP